MARFTDGYGALTSIQDLTNSYTYSDSKGNDYTFEVHPIEITKDDINKALEEIGNTRIWFVAYKTFITQPSERQINQALTDGLLLVLSINCVLIDNYGITHNVIYNKDKGKYEIKVSKVSQLINKNIKATQLVDKFISVIKESDDPSSLIRIDNSTKIILNNLYTKMDEQEQIISNLQNNSGGGSTEELEMRVFDLEKRLQELEMKFGR